MGKREILKRRLRDFLIQSQKGGGFSSTSFQKVFKDLYRIVGFDDCSSHTGRRKFITDLSDKGVSVRVIQELARHRDLATTYQLPTHFNIVINQTVKLSSL